MGAMRMKNNYDFSKITILIVDDETSILKAVRRTLIPEGFTVLTAESGKEGLEILEKEKIDLIISDYKMPEMNGFEFLKQVKKLYPKIYRIILSGYIEEGIVSEAILKGIASTFIGKPWEIDVLINKIKQISKIYMTINNEKLLEYINSIEKLPSLPETYKEISQAIEQGASAKELEGIIKKDVSLTTELLHIANSIFYGTFKVMSLKQAIVRIGNLQLKNLILFNSINKIPVSESQKPYMKELFNIAFISSKYYGQLYKKIYDERVSINYEAIPLLYNIGKILLLQFDFDNFLKIIQNLSKENNYSFAEVEEILNKSINHKELGAYFLCSWNLPEIFIEASLFYNTPDAISPEYDKEIKALCAIDKIISFLKYGKKEELKNIDICNKITKYENIEDIITEIEDELNNMGE
jgi:HD-like signal output (HDOD) protein